MGSVKYCCCCSLTVVGFNVELIVAPNVAAHFSAVVVAVTHVATVALFAVTTVIFFPGEDTVDGLNEVTINFSKILLKSHIYDNDTLNNN